VDALQCFREMAGMQEAPLSVLEGWIIVSGPSARPRQRTIALAIVDTLCTESGLVVSSRRLRPGVTLP
jgi:hypothetical protein